MQERVAHRAGAAANHHAHVDQLVDGLVRGAQRKLRLNQIFGRRYRRIARRHAHLQRKAQEAIEEGFNMRLQFRARDLVGFGDISGHRPTKLIGLRLIAFALGDGAIGVKVFLRQMQRAEGLQIGVFALFGRAPFNGFAAALRGHPNWGMWLLHRTRPQIHIIKIIMTAMIFERPLARPRLQNQIMGFIIALVRERRVHASRVIFRPDAAHKAGDDAPARHLVEHREFLRNVDRIVHQRQRAAQYRYFSVFRCAREGGGNQVWRRHQAISCLMMLVDANAVEAQLIGQLQLANIAIIGGFALGGIKV